MHMALYKEMYIVLSLVSTEYVQQVVNVMKDVKT